jgi:hypothetical protein
MSKLLNFKPVEPLKSNRFLIKIEGVDIPNYLFRKYKLHNESDNLIFTTSFYETVNYIFNPKDFFNIISVDIQYLDPIGEVVNGLKFDVKGSNFESKESYKNDDLKITKLRFIVNVDTITPYFKNSETQDEEPVLRFVEGEIKSNPKTKNKNGKK